MLTETLGDKKIHFVTKTKIPNFFLRLIVLLVKKKVTQNSAYGRHRSSRPMRIEESTPKENFFFGCMDGRTEVRTYRRGGWGGVTCHAKAVKLCMKLSR